MLETVIAIFTNTVFLNNFLLMAFFFIFVYLFWKENKDDKSPISWTDLLVDDKSGKASLTKIGHFWGIALSSWITMYMAQQLSGDQISAMFPWIFGTWLTFLVASSGMKTLSMTKDKTEIKIDKPENKNGE